VHRQRFGLAAVAVAVVSLTLAGCGPSAAAPTVTSPANPSPSAKVTKVPRVLSASFSRRLDGTGRAIHPTTTFQGGTDQRVYLVVEVKNLAPGAKVSYLRTLDGKYVDAKSIAVRPKVRRVYFEWSAAQGRTLSPGQYLVHVYLNGSRAWEGQFQVL
jgi:hypothetical protein